MSTSIGEWACQQMMAPTTDDLRWYYEPLSQRVWFNYRDGDGCRCLTYAAWLKSLDMSCRSAVAQTVEQVHDDKLTRCCHFSHDDDCWYRMQVEEQVVEPFEQVLISGTLTCLSRQSGIGDQLYLQSDSGLLSCPMFRSFLIQALQSNAHNGESLVLMAVYIRDMKSGERRDEVATVLRRDLRRTDLIGLFRQQELLVLLNGVSGEGANRIADKLSASLSHESLPATTIGWAVFPQDGENVDTLIERRYQSQLQNVDLSSGQ
ncbi:GGDEF domain-containing protein [Celerinatantimonas sp. MCCC 1A17872]|uniref:GGDEF domain-containing protein n=1 Tax=Celerinatantimonas sp. MCCC 1A17872 TaxID=3177514 RepID=UPI0038C6A920